MKKLSKQQVLALQSQLIQQSGGTDGIRDDGLLESALNSPFQSFSGQELYPTVLEKGARLCFGLVRNHPFLDGNKRIGTHVMMIFLYLNGISIDCQDEELIFTILSVASGALDYAGLLQWLQSHVHEDAL